MVETRFEPPQLVTAQVVNIRRYALRVGGSYLTCVPLFSSQKQLKKNLVVLEIFDVQILSFVLNVIKPLPSEFQ